MLTASQMKIKRRQHEITTKIYLVNDNPSMCLCNAQCVFCPKQHKAIYIDENVYIERYAMYIEGIRYRVSPPMFRVLCAFDTYQGKVLSRAFLLAYGWGLENKVSNNVTVAISELRVLLKKQSNLEIITVHGKGYQLINKSKANIK